VREPPTSITLDGLDFNLVGSLDPERGPDNAPVEFMPQAQYAKAATAKLHSHGLGPFCRLRVAQGIRQAGLYLVLCDAVRYVGICGNLAERWGPRGYGAIHPRNCYAGGQLTNCKVNAGVLREVKEGSTPLLYFRAQQAGRQQSEAALIALLRPPWNAGWAARPS
jgi:hypothetical protein